jgi:ribose transport system substrate-binding protein
MIRSFLRRTLAAFRWSTGSGLLCLSVLVAGALLVAGCGSSGGGSSSSESTGGTEGASTAEGGAGAAGGKAAEVVAQAEKPIESWDGFGSPIKPPSGKKVTLIECSSLGTGCVKTAETSAEAAKELGWETNIVNGKGDPTVWNAAIKNAVATKADGIILYAISPAVVTEGIAAAEAAGIPVVSALIGPKASSLVVTDLNNTAERLAAVAALDNEDGKTLILDSPEFQFIHEQSEALVKDLEGFCPACEAEIQAFDFATMATKLPSQVASEVRADPSIELIVAPFSAAVPFVRQGLQQVGSHAKITCEGEAEVLESTGDGTQLATVAAPAGWLGWQSVDDLARLLLDEPVSETALPTRLFTEKNSDEVGEWEGDSEIDFRAEYKKLWGK